MLSDTQRVAMMPNPEGMGWYHHLQSRFVGSFRASRITTYLALEFRQLTALEGAHAEFAGLLEFGEAEALPVVTEVSGAIDLENREFRFEPIPRVPGSDRYSGRFSENGRVLELHWTGTSGAREMLLVHEPSLAELHNS